ncbi:MAG: hypothetical protein IMF08_03350 [Proteobacteria bacterium]|nr:hypothetical protein [Pseudomonadota bacterium]
MRSVTVLALAAAMFSTACGQPHRPIPAGTYLPPAGEERIVVTPSRIWFHVNVDRENPNIIGSREYPYEVEPDGTIHFVVSSNSTFGLRLRMEHDWAWRGTEIVKTHVESGEETRFVFRD